MMGEELTSGQSDYKESLYFGKEHGKAHPKVLAGLPFHGNNLYPSQVPELKTDVLKWFKHMSVLGDALLQGIA